uniref:Uncharacterized protein n=1 Tax=Arundo donax TaxID=35708 RepID=A0A0A9C6B4_ARUDO
MKLATSFKLTTGYKLTPHLNRKPHTPIRCKDVLVGQQETIFNISNFTLFKSSLLLPCF